MKIDKKAMNRCKDLVLKHAPKTLSQEGLALIAINAILGPRIATLRLQGYSDEEIIKLLEEEA